MQIKLKKKCNLRIKMSHSSCIANKQTLNFLIRHTHKQLSDEIIDGLIMTLQR